MSGDGGGWWLLGGWRLLGEPSAPSAGVGRSCCESRPRFCCKASTAGHGSEVIVQAKPTIANLLKMLKDGGGPAESPTASGHDQFLWTLDEALPELRFYRAGRIQTSPGIEEVEGSPAEYYRTIGALIALLSAFSYVNGDPEFGLAAVSAGNRGPMSVDKVPGKFINIGARPDNYRRFCETFAVDLHTEDDWWAMLVFLAVHDIGKSDEFRNEVNQTLPEAKRSDDHDRALARALENPELVERLLPSVNKLSQVRQRKIAAGFATNFQLPQLGQGEISVGNLRGLLELPQETLEDGTLRQYLYHSIFDIAGAASTEAFIFPLAVVPVYVGFADAMDELIEALKTPPSVRDKPDDRNLYFRFLLGNFKKAYPGFNLATFHPMCESRIFRDEAGLVFLRVLALTRNTYQNPEALLSLIQTEFPLLVAEMAGRVAGPQVMLYYGPDLLRMGLGTDMADESGENMRAALQAVEDIYRLARGELMAVTATDYQFELNVQPAVVNIKQAGKDWRGGAQLRELCTGAKVVGNELKTEGLLKLKDFTQL